VNMTRVAHRATRCSPGGIPRHPVDNPSNCGSSLIAHESLSKQPEPPRTSRKDRSVDAVLLLFLSIAYVLIVAAYLSSERFFYYWDWGGFQWVALNDAFEFLQWPQHVLTQIGDSIHLEYNHYYVLPLIPLLEAFGKSRLSYVLSVTLVYQVPFSLVVSGIACKLIPFRPRAVFWSTALIVLMMPVALAPTLRGYPDVGAALLMGSAILIYVQDTRMGKWWQLALIGLFLGTAILYRRHYAYGGIALLATIALQAMLRVATAARLGRGQAWYELLVSGLRMGIIGAITLLCLAIIGRPFLLKMLTTDYGELYASYALPPGFVFDFYLSNYGWIILPLALLGFAIGAKKGVVDRPVAQTLMLLGGISFLQWILLVRQVGVHYTLHFTPFVLLGLSAFFWTIWSTRKDASRWLILSGGMGLLIVNAVIVLSPQPINPKLQRLFSYRYPPLFRTDYDQIVELVDYLRSSIPERAGIYVVDSSSRMNYDLLIKAEQELYPDQKLNVFVTPQIDSRDFYPLELLLRASYVIVSTPAQYHLTNNEEQKVVKAVHEAFTDGWEIAGDFMRLPEQFELSEDVMLSIYQRESMTSLETAIKTFDRMRVMVGRRPGSQSDWIDLTPGLDSPMSKIGENTWGREIVIQADIPEEGYQMLFADPAPAAGKVTGSWRILNEASCSFIPGIEILDPSGHVLETDEMNAVLEDKSAFSLDFDSLTPAYLVLHIKPLREDARISPCSVELEWVLIE